MPSSIVDLQKETQEYYDCKIDQLKKDSYKELALKVEEFDNQKDAEQSESEESKSDKKQKDRSDSGSSNNKSEENDNKRSRKASRSLS